MDYPRQGRTGFRRWIPSWRLVLGALLTLLALGVGAFVAAYASTDIPTPSDFADNQKTTVYYADGTTVMGSFGEQNRVIVGGDQIPEHVRDAVVAAEDRSFYDNPGINPSGLVRALVNNVRGGEQQGGSSITQQYAERYYIGQTVGDYRGKIREALLAMKLARAEDKDEILANYLNTIYLGRGTYGIESAARAYFGVGAAELTVSQAALIAGIIPSPNNWDPHVSPEDAERRWNYVLDGMVTMGTLDAAEREALVFPIAEVIEYAPSDTYAGPQGYLLDTVRRELTGRGGLTDEDLDTTGYSIVTTIDPAMQQAAVAAVDTLPDDAAPNLRTALVSLEAATGAIKAMYGGPDFLTQSRNAVTQDVAQAGSTFKPFTLVAYLEAGNSLKSRYDGDSQVDVEGWPEGGPRNFGDEDFGNIDVETATANSVNSVYAQMNAEVGPQATLDVAYRAGLSEDTAGMEPLPSNVLGTASPHPLDMARAYNTFAAQGMRTQPFIVQSVEYLDGGLVYEGPTAPEKVFEPDIMADTTYALTQVVEEGSGEAARELGRPVAGKTGTSSDNRSAWFVGYTPQLTTAVALYQVGPNNETEEITPFGGRRQITGGSFPADIWTAFMIPAMSGMEVMQFPERADVGKPNVVEVPSVIGLSEADAVATLEAAGFGVEIQRAPSKDQPEGVVFDQDPTGVVAPGTTVAIAVSEGPATVAVPNVVGLSEADAVAQLQALGLSASVTQEENEAPAGQVISSSPAAGTEVDEGTAVAIVVSSGPPEDNGNGNGNGGGLPLPTPTTPVEPPGGGGGEEPPPEP